MPSPSFAFRGLFTVLELQTMLIQLATTGRITSVSGAAKSSSFENMSADKLAVELRAELDRLQGRGRAQKVQSRFVETCYSEGGTITTP